jgi:hypothetical protein
MDFMPNPTKAGVLTLILWWLFLFGVLSIAQWRSKRAFGLPLAYALALSLIHPIGAIPYALDFYTPRSQVLLDNGSSVTNTYTGLFVALIGFAAFVTGVVIRPLFFPPRDLPAAPRLHPNISNKLPHTLLIMSIVFFLFISPVLRRIPSVGQLGISGTMLSVLALVLLAQQAAQKGDFKRMWFWLVSTLMFPLVTITFMGFASYGGAAAASVWAISYRFIKPRIVAVLGLALMLYCGLTFYTNYMRERTSIREKVWGGGGIQSRLDSLRGMMNNFELLNLKSQYQMETIDGRLNQNDLVGKAVLYLRAGRVGFAEGGTLYIAMVAWIPRIIWPSKPNIGGSGGLVSRFTGQKFAEGTSIGVGQVLEFYVNWGLTSIIIGFLLYGCLIQYLDQRAGEGLLTGDLWMAVKWGLPGLSLMQAGGSLAETIGSLAAGFVFIAMMQKFVFGKYYDDGPGSAMTLQHSNRPRRGSKYPQSVG